MLALIALIFVGLAVIAVAAVMLGRFTQGTKRREAPEPDRKRGEREVYEQLYGKRSRTVSVALPVEPPPHADANGPCAHTSSADRG